MTIPVVAYPNHELESKARCYRMLADCYHLPGPNLIEIVTELHQQLLSICPNAADALAPGMDELTGFGWQESLTVDYSRLFVGPFSLLAAPYGSVYLEEERRVMGDSTVAVSGWLLAEGLEAADNFFDALDHVTVELEFLHYLLCMALNSAAEGSNAEALVYHGKYEEFLYQNLGAWIEPFTKSVEESARTEFYRHLAQATRRLIEMELCNDPSPAES